MRESSLHLDCQQPVDSRCLGNMQHMHAPQGLQAPQNDNRTDLLAGERQQRCDGHVYRLGRRLRAGQGHVMAQRVALLHRLVHRGLDRVNDLAGVCAARPSPDLDAPALVDVYDTSVCRAVDGAVARRTRSQAEGHWAERARPAVVGDVVDVNDDDLAVSLVGYAALERLRL